MFPVYRKIVWKTALTKKCVYSQGDGTMKKLIMTIVLAMVTMTYGNVMAEGSAKCEYGCRNNSTDIT